MALFRCGSKSGTTLRGYHRKYIESNTNKHAYSYIDDKGNVSTGTTAADPIVTAIFLSSGNYQYTANVDLWYNGTKFHAGDVVISSGGNGYYWFTQA